MSKQADTQVRERIEAAKAQQRIRAQTLKLLEKLAQEINEEYAEAANHKGAEADFFRLKAACKLAEAKEKCAKIGMKFMPWCEENIDRPYPDISRLIRPGILENECAGEGAKWLERMRAQVIKRAKKTREKKKNKIAELEKTVSSLSSEATQPRMRDLFNTLSAKSKIRFIEWACRETGGRFVFEDSTGDE